MSDELDKLRSFSITCYSRQLKEYNDMYDLWDHRIGDPLPKGVPSFRPEDYPKEVKDNVIYVSTWFKNEKDK